jgi:putative transposase
MTLGIMNRIDRIYTDYPFYGSRKICYLLNEDGIQIGRDKVRSLMAQMGLRAIYCAPNTSTPNLEHKKYPYLLKGIKISTPNQVWATDITYIKLEKGFVYLVAVLDWYSRYVLSWEISNSLDTSFCISALQNALKINTPKIFNTDQGSQFTSIYFTDILKSAGVQISMDGKGRCFDNIFVERLWRTVKYENIFLKDYETIKDLTLGLEEYFKFYNDKRIHSGIKCRRPYELYFEK